MIGLTDRLQPWARRFQRAPRAPVAPEAKTADETGRARGRFARTASTETGDPATTTVRRKTGRFARRPVQQR